MKTGTAPVELPRLLVRIREEQATQGRPDGLVELDRAALARVDPGLPAATAIRAFRSLVYRRILTPADGGPADLGKPTLYAVAPPPARPASADGPDHRLVGVSRRFRCSQREWWRR